MFTGGTLLPIKLELPPTQIVLGLAVALATGGGKILKLTMAVSGPHSLEAITRIVCVPTLLNETVGVAEVEVEGTPPEKVHAYVMAFVPQLITFATGLMVTGPQEFGTGLSVTCGGCFTVTVSVYETVPQGFVTDKVTK
jgi:hypothetical protein